MIIPAILLIVLVFGIEPYVAWKNGIKQPVCHCYFELLKWVGLRKLTEVDYFFQAGSFQKDTGRTRYLWAWSKEWRGGK